MAPKATQKAQSPIQTLWKAYNEETLDRLKFIDSLLVFLMLSGIVQFLYCILVTNYPFNAFLAGYTLLLYCT
jgi:oligosaccharyltransferase complex subunit epsilon